jgi:hypothetical protein
MYNYLTAKYAKKITKNTKKIIHKFGEGVFCHPERLPATGRKSKGLINIYGILPPSARGQNDICIADKTVILS